MWIIVIPCYPPHVSRMASLRAELSACELTNMTKYGPSGMSSLGKHECGHDKRVDFDKADISLSLK